MKYSIITATYNAERFVERCLASILSQTYPDFEWIVQDGASTDRTAEIIARYPDVRLRFASEPDCGIYDAWNRGVRRASGDWALFLGADDFFLNENILVKCHRHIRRLEKNILFAYAALAQFKGNEIVQIANYSLRTLYNRFVRNMPFPMPATFIRMALLRQHRFDYKKYKIAADYELAAKYALHDNIARIPVMAVGMEEGGISSSSAETFCQREDEAARVLYEVILPRSQKIVLGCLNHFWSRDEDLED
jgi:glycosyltransferase involved in cell wall biosynthesis